MTASSQHEYVPQFPDGSGWDVEEDGQWTYFYEHITRREARDMRAASGQIIYKIVCIQYYDQLHQNTYFVKGASLTAFLQRPTFTALLPERIVSIEQVESMPSTDEKLT